MRSFLFSISGVINSIMTLIGVCMDLGTKFKLDASIKHRFADDNKTRNSH